MYELHLSCLVFTLFALMANSLDLLTPQTLNSTEEIDQNLPDTSIIKNATNARFEKVGCFKQEYHQEPQLSRTNFIDCSNAEKKIAALESQGPIEFFRNNDSTFILPNTFTYRTCVINLDMIDADAEDFFYVRQIREVVIDTARRCTSLRRPLGGKALAGPKKLMAVYIVGRE